MLVDTERFTILLAKKRKRLSRYRERALNRACYYTYHTCNQKSWRSSLAALFLGSVTLYWLGYSSQHRVAVGHTAQYGAETRLDCRVAWAVLCYSNGLAGIALFVGPVFSFVFGTYYAAKGAPHLPELRTLLPSVSSVMIGVQSWSVASLCGCLYVREIGL